MCQGAAGDCHMPAPELHSGRAVACTQHEEVGAMDEVELIACYIEDDPLQPGPADARLKDYGTAVWALVSYLDRAVHGDIEQAAMD